MQDVEKRKRTLVNIAYFAVIIAIAAFGIRYALGVCLPFVIAFAAAAALQKPKNFLVKKTFLKNGAASALCVILSLGLAAALFSLVGVRLFSEIKGFFDYFIIQIQDIGAFADKAEAWINGMISHFPEFIKETLAQSSQKIFSDLREYLAENDGSLAGQIASTVTGKFSFSWLTTPLSGVVGAAKQLPSVFVTVLITLISCCFMTSEFDKVTGFIKLQFPEEKRADLTRAKHILKAAMGKMGKAYLLIMLITFVEMSVGLTVLRFVGVFESNYLLVIAAATAIVDILPLFGTGAVLFPWAVYSLIMGNAGLAIGLVVIYAVISVIRQIIEPRLVAGQLGLSPIVTIAAMYFGLKLFGVLGMFVMPILIIMLKLLNDEGIVKLWKGSASDEKTEPQSENGEAVKSAGEESEKADENTAE